VEFRNDGPGGPSTPPRFLTKDLCLSTLDVQLQNIQCLNVELLEKVLKAHTLDILALLTATRNITARKLTNGTQCARPTPQCLSQQSGPLRVWFKILACDFVIIAIGLQRDHSAFTESVEEIDRHVANEGASIDYDPRINRARKTTVFLSN
jgi:hypothetical protein